MSAKHDQNQGFKFLYENLYQLYRREKAENAQGAVAVHVEPQIETTAPRNGQVLKFGDAKAQANVETYRPMEILPTPAAVAQAPAESAATTVDPEAYQDPVVESLKANLADLRDLQSRLHFMLDELREIEGLPSSNPQSSDDDSDEGSR